MRGMCLQERLPSSSRLRDSSAAALALWVTTGAPSGGIPAMGCKSSPSRQVGRVNGQGWFGLGEQGHPGRQPRAGCTGDLDPREGDGPVFIATNTGGAMRLLYTTYNVSGDITDRTCGLLHVLSVVVIRLK